MTLWTSEAAEAATGGRTTAAWKATGVSIDTRSLQPGDLFVALKAARDGHDFVAQALEKGAAAALVSRVPDGLPADAPLLIVKDVLEGLEGLGRAARTRMSGKVVAVTGSAGKTTTKEMLRATLSGQGQVHAAEASYNNHWGAPLTLARMPEETQFAVIEIGMNHPGEIAPLTRMARPHVAVVTTVAAAHLEAFDSVAGIAREKASIFEGLEPKGIAIYNGDLEVSPLLHAVATRHAARLISFGQARSNHHRVTEVRVGDTTTVAQGRAWRQPVLWKLRAAGRHYAMNGMAVLAVASALGLDRALAVTDLGQWSPGAGRGLRQVITLDPVETHLTIELIDEAYNANPASMAAALEVLAAAETVEGVGRKALGRRVAYLGDMRELGPQEKDLHRALAELPSLDRVQVVHCVGPLMHELYRALPAEKRGRWCETAEAMSKYVRRDVDAGDVVMVKGSLSMGLRHVVDALQKMGQARARHGQEEE